MLKLAGCIKLFPLPLAVSLSFNFHVEQEQYYSTRESARSLEDEGLRYSTILMNFSTTKLDLDVHGLKECLLGINCWKFFLFVSVSTEQLVGIRTEYSVFQLYSPS
ncbi:hypothetical protein IMY05_006G0225300 [Salix suchowensis]|nr:hypothetical protein IMY05_006G0225300 [Salix suchowensis]